MNVIYRKNHDYNVRLFSYSIPQTRSHTSGSSPQLAETETQVGFSKVTQSVKIELTHEWLHRPSSSHHTLLSPAMIPIRASILQRSHLEELNQHSEMGFERSIPLRRINDLSRSCGDLSGSGAAEPTLYID